MHKTGFTLVELLIAAFLIVITIAVSFQAFISLNQNYGIITSYLSSYLKGREIIDEMAKDCRIAIRVMDSFSTYTTTDSCLVLKAPSVDANGNIIDINHNFDYIIYRIYNNDLWKIVIPGTTSSRTGRDNILKKSIESLYITSSGVPLSSISHKSSIPHVTIRISAVETFQGKDYRATPGTTVKLMNYEWGFVR